MKNPIIRTIYLYLFALIGLGVLVIGLGRFVNLGLKMFVFTKADQEYKRELPSPYLVERKDVVMDLSNCQEECNLTTEQKQQIAEWLIDYETWKESMDNEDYLKARRHSEAAGGLAMIIVGLPLWLYHWGIIKREKKKEA